MNIKGVTQRGDYTYRFVVSDGFDGNGKQVRHTMTYKVPDGTPKTKAEKMVLEAYTDFTRKCRCTKALDDNMRFKELVEIYFKQYAPNNLKEVTSYNYQKDLRIHILPIFANKKIKDITTQALSKFFTGLDRSPETTRKLKIVMSSVMAFGVQQGYISSNPCSGALYKKDTNQDEKIKFLNKEQCQKLMEATSEYSTFNTIIQFLLFTGLRIGECLGLRWCDIDFENKVIYINNTLSYAGDTWFLSSPKTKESRRFIKFTTHVTDLLLRHKEAQDKLKEVVGDAWVHPDMVFTSEIGNYYCRSFTNKQLKKVLAENGLPIISVHGLRHSNASLLINNGTPLKAVSGVLGHSTTLITSQIYVHIFDEYNAKMAEALENDLI